MSAYPPFLDTAADVHVPAPPSRAVRAWLYAIALVGIAGLIVIEAIDRIETCVRRFFVTPEFNAQMEAHDAQADRLRL